MSDAQPSRAAWRELCQRLDAQPDDALPLAELQAQLAAWPDPLRTVPGSWLRRLLDGEDEPRLELARSLDHVLFEQPARRARHAWANSPRLASLRTLRIHDEEPGDAGALAFARGPHSDALTELALATGITARGAETLSASPRLQGVRTLSLNRNRIGAGGVAALCASPHLGALRRLHLGRNALGDDALGLLARSNLRLEVLDLDCNAFTSAGLAELVAAPLAAGLTELNLSNTALDLEACRALATSPHLAGLRVLFLHNCQLTDEAAQALLASPHLRSLGNLALSENQLGPETVEALARCAQLASLYELDVCHNPFDPAAAEVRLRAAPQFTGLRRLCV